MRQHRMGNLPRGKHIELGSDSSVPDKLILILVEYEIMVVTVMTAHVSIRCAGGIGLLSLLKHPGPMGPRNCIWLPSG
jgi:hypothetical protein